MAQAFTLTVDGAPETLDTTAISNAVGKSSGTDGTGTESYVASVPNDTHDVDLSMDDAGFTQAFSLWSLKRTTPRPAVLYEGPFGSGPSEQLSVSKALTLRFQGGGTYPAQVFATSAALSAFNPDGTDAAAPPDDVYLVLTMVADNDAAEMNQLSFPTALTPLAGSAVTFRAASGRTYAAEASDQSQDESNASVNDDGPARRHLRLLGPEHVDPWCRLDRTCHDDGRLLDERRNDVIDVSGPLRFSVGFPAVGSASHPAQAPVDWRAQIPRRGCRTDLVQSRAGFPSCSRLRCSPSSSQPCWCSDDTSARCSGACLAGTQRPNLSPTPRPLRRCRRSSPTRPKTRCCRSTSWDRFACPPSTGH